MAKIMFDDLKTRYFKHINKRPEILDSGRIYWNFGDQFCPQA